MAPAFCQTYPDNVQLPRKITKKGVGRRMKVQGWGDQVNDWRRSLKLHAGEITVALEIALLQMAPHAKPIVCRLYRKMDVLAGF